VSSPVFAVRIRPDPRLQLLVRLTGLLFCAAGAAAIGVMDLSWPWRALCMAAWIGDCARALYRQQRAARRVATIRIDAEGGISGRAADGTAVGLRLMTGSVVLANIAWLRLRLDDGSEYGQLLAARCSENEAWHGLQLIWQQCRESFGQSCRA